MLSLSSGVHCGRTVSELDELISSSELDDRFPIIELLEVLSERELEDEPATGSSSELLEGLLPSELEECSASSEELEGLSGELDDGSFPSELLIPDASQL